VGKKKKQGHFCKICQSYRANEKFSGKGHQQHICKVCNRELQQQKRIRKKANKQAIEAGLRPLKMDYPKTPQQVASYLQISLDEVEDACEQLDLKPCHFDPDWADPVALYDIEAIIAVSIFTTVETEPVDTNTE